MRASKIITPGFDYRLGQNVAMHNHEWRALIQQIEAKGGYVKVQDGETWLIERGPPSPLGRVHHLAFEIYGYISH